MDHLYFYAPQFTVQDWNIVPGIHSHQFAATENPGVPYTDVITGALSDISRRTGKPLDTMRISWIDDGPYVVPVQC